MRVFVKNPEKIEKLVRAYMLSAYEGCGGTTGLGYLSQVNHMDLNSILDHCHVYPKLSYGGSDVVRISGDYVAGRMVKTDISYSKDGGWVEISDHDPSPDYQGWSFGYPTDRGVLANFSENLGGSSGVSTVTKFRSYRELLEMASLRAGVQLIFPN